MTGEELMIGDWVYVPGTGNVKVCSLTRKKIGYHKTENETRMHYVLISRCEPVKITIQFLKDNDWGLGRYFIKKYMDPHDATMLNFERTVVDLGEKGSREIFHVSIRHHETYMFEGGYGIFKINYVHQLQHRLRDCDLADIARELKFK